MFPISSDCAFIVTFLSIYLNLPTDQSVLYPFFKTSQQDHIILFHLSGFLMSHILVLLTVWVSKSVHCVLQMKAPQTYIVGLIARLKYLPVSLNPWIHLLSRIFIWLLQRLKLNFIWSYSTMYLILEMKYVLGLCSLLS